MNKRIGFVVLNYHIQRLVAHLMFLLVGRQIIRHGLDMKTCDTWEVLFSIHLTNNQRQYILCWGTQDWMCTQVLWNCHSFVYCVHTTVWKSCREWGFLRLWLQSGRSGHRSEHMVYRLGLYCMLPNVRKFSSMCIGILISLFKNHLAGESQRDYGGPGRQYGCGRVRPQSSWCTCALACWRGMLHGPERKLHLPFLMISYPMWNGFL